MHIISRRSLFALALAGASSVVAGKQLPTVHVSAQDANTIEIACRNPKTPSSATVARLLNLHTDDEANRLRFKLAKVAAEACAAGAPLILVERSGNGQELIWTAAAE
jgi:hypothetical protein